eukprot:10809546-Karenia_brevis.AAC.1
MFVNEPSSSSRRLMASPKKRHRTSAAVPTLSTVVTSAKPFAHFSARAPAGASVGQRLWSLVVCAGNQSGFHTEYSGLSASERLKYEERWQLQWLGSKTKDYASKVSAFWKWHAWCQARGMERPFAPP